MSNQSDTFDTVDHKIAEALRSKGWIMPTDGRDIECDDVPPLPKNLQDSSKIISEIIRMAEEGIRLPYHHEIEPSSILKSDDLHPFAMAARKGINLSPKTEEKLKSAKLEILKRRACKKK